MSDTKAIKNVVPEVKASIEKTTEEAKSKPPEDTRGAKSKSLEDTNEADKDVSDIFDNPYPALDKDALEFDFLYNHVKSGVASDIVKKSNICTKEKKSKAASSVDAVDTKANTEKSLIAAKDESEHKLVHEQNKSDTKPPMDSSEVYEKEVYDLFKFGPTSDAGKMKSAPAKPSLTQKSDHKYSELAKKIEKAVDYGIGESTFKNISNAKKYFDNVDG
eukprot:TRINITY_DN11091_c0_g1_i1.p1 TRINITY_DN11091_c0_g1~~TRINITY_DN11091_c0_g1_i1.p1  ORF type:complete len:218 (+),score=32.94 TRINITY_DN11091_c0_g1_i1:673-1326(+)